MERGRLADVTVREVALLAGVAVGTFYEYVANMRALAALTIHLRVKALAQAFEACQRQHQALPWPQQVAALIDNQLRLIGADAAAWAALFRVEREVSSPEAYNRHYEQFVGLWDHALAPVLPDAAPHAPRAQVARMVHCMVYGAVAQALLTQGPGLDMAGLQAELTRAVQAYLGVCINPA